jgi:hypothetical protein
MRACVSVRSAFLLLAIAVVAAGVDVVSAATLYGVRRTGTGGGSALHRINPATGATTVVGSIGFENVGGIDFHPNGTLYGVGKRPGPNVWVLIRIDPVTGAGTEVGPLVNTLATGGHFDIAFRKSDGVLFLIAAASAGNPVALFTVNLTTGTATLVGNTTTNAGGNALGFTLSDTLHHATDASAGTLYTVNPTTGVSGAPTVGLTYSGFSSLSGGQELNAMDAHPDTGVLYVGVNDGATPISGPNYLATLDPATGVVTHLGPSVNGLVALAWQPSPCVVTLYGVAQVGTPPARKSTLYRIDASDGSAQLVGPIEFNRVGAIDFHPVNGVLYGVGQRPSGNTNVLIRINPITGRATEVGPLGATFPTGGHFDLSFRGSDDKLFLNAFGPSGTTVALFTVNVDTGLATLVGDTTTADEGNALEFARNNTLYLLNNDNSGTRFTVDPSTGAAGSPMLISYMGFPPLIDPRPNAMDTNPANGLMYVSVNDGSSSSGPNYVGIFDPGTGAVTFVGSTVIGLDAIAFRLDCTDYDVCSSDSCRQCQSAGLPCIRSCVLLGSAYVTNNGLATLYRIDAQTGAATAIGPIGFERVGSLEFDARGTLFGIGERHDGSNTTVLIQIDPSTGVGTEVGALTVSASGGGHFDLAARNADGVMFFDAFSLTFGGPGLFTVNKSTGFATEIGNMVLASGGNALEFSPTDVLYHVNADGGGTVYEVDQVTGASGGAPQPLIYAGFPTLIEPRVNSMDYSLCEGKLYASITDNLVGQSGPNYLATLIPSTGITTFVAQTVSGLDGMAFYSTEAVCCHSPLAGPVVFPHTLLATSRTRFDWYLPEDVVVVQGDLSALSSYGTTSTTTPSMATSFAAPTSPATPGTGFYYLVQGDCPTASWSTGTPRECTGPPGCLAGGRDGNLP